MRFSFVCALLSVALGCLDIPDSYGGAEVLGASASGCASTVRNGDLIGVETSIGSFGTFSQCVDAVAATGANGATYSPGSGECWKEENAVVSGWSTSYWSCFLQLPTITYPTAASCAGPIRPGYPLEDTSTETSAGNKASLEDCAAHGVANGATGVAWDHSSTECLLYTGTPTQAYTLKESLSYWGCFLPSYQTILESKCQDVVTYGDMDGDAETYLASGASGFAACADAALADDPFTNAITWDTDCYAEIGARGAATTSHTSCFVRGICGATVGGDGYLPGTGQCDITKSLGTQVDLDACIAAADGLALVDGLQFSDSNECFACSGYAASQTDNGGVSCKVASTSKPDYETAFQSATCLGSVRAGLLNGNPNLIGSFPTFDACMQAANILAAGQPVAYENSKEGTDADCFVVPDATTCTPSLDWVICCPTCTDTYQAGGVVGDPDFLPLFGKEKHMFHVVLKQDTGVYNLVSDKDFIMNTQIFSAYTKNGDYANQWMEKIFLQYNATRVEVTNTYLVIVNGAQILTSEIVVDGVRIVKKLNDGVYITLPNGITWRLSISAISQKLQRVQTLRTAAAGVLPVVEADMNKLEVHLVQGTRSSFSRCVSGLIGYAARFANLDLVEKFYPGQAEDFAVDGPFAKLNAEAC